MSYALWCVAAAVLATAGVSFWFLRGGSGAAKGSDEFSRRW